MIDTIVLRLNNIDQYNKIRTQYETKTTDTQSDAYVKKTDIKNDNNAQVLSRIYFDSGSIIPISKRSSTFIPSSHYNLSYFLNLRLNYLEFNFSIPKFVYSTNLLQFIPYFSQKPDEIFSILKDFITEFINKYFIEDIKYSDLQIHRLDLCYNQFFANKLDALYYLDKQKEFLVKYARSSKNNFRSYDTSLLYVTKRYSFKIYHKGTEFHKHDLKHLANNNPKGFSIPQLKEISDKILRYEITFRSSFIEYLFIQNKLFEPYIPVTLFDLEHQNNPYDDNYNPNFKKDHEKQYLIAQSLNYINKSKQFVFDTSREHAFKNFKSKFSQSLFNYMYIFFWDYVKKFQVECMLDILEVQKRIEQQNELIKSKNSIRRKQESEKGKTRLSIIALLAQHQNLDQLYKTGLIPKSTVMKYKQELKKIGINAQMKPLNIAKPTLDYIDYKFYFGKHHLK